MRITSGPGTAMAAVGKMDLTIPLEPVRAFAEPPGVDDAVGLLADAPVHAIGYGFTSSAYVLGAAGEEAMLARPSERAHGSARRRVLHPPSRHCASSPRGGSRSSDRPGSMPELSELGAQYYRAAGFEVVFSSSADLPSDQRLIEPGGLYEWTIRNVPTSAEAVTIGGHGLRAVGVIDALETELGRPVLTANQVLLWALMVAAGAEPSTVTGYGRLFTLPPTR